MSESSTLTFALAAHETGLTGSRIDRENKIIRGVTMIKGGITADGHDLFVDDTTIRQLYELAVKRNKVPVTLEHTGGIKDVNGYLTNFVIQGDKLKADWHLLENHNETPVMLERAERQPETFGLSVAFKGQGVMVNGKKCARAERLLSADCVKRPAAAPDGLFSAVDNTRNSMPEDIQETLKKIADTLQQIAARQDSLEAAQAAIYDTITNPPVDVNEIDDVALLEYLANCSDEELDAFNAQYGTDITRDDIQADIDSLLAADIGSNDGGVSEVASEADAGADSPVAAALSALAKEVIELKAKDKKERVLAKHEFEAATLDELRVNISALVDQRDRLVELAERVISENEALRMAGIRGGSPAGAGAEIEFRERHNGGSIIEFEVVANEAYRKMRERGVSELSAKSAAIDFAVKRHPIAYKLWRERGAPDIQFSED